MNKNKQKSIRLDRLLANLGYGGRKEMTMAIKNEWLEIDGGRVKTPSLSIDPAMVEEGRVTFDGQALDPLSPFTIMLHKPAGYTCSHKDPDKIIYDLLPDRFAQRKPAFSAVGRLDKYSSGMVLMSDDGDLMHRITSPKSKDNVAKTYRVTVRDDLRGDEMALFAAGDFMMKGEGKPLAPAEWTPADKRSGVMVLHEGRNRQIRRMFEQLGNEVVTLHRYQTGSLDLGDLPEGQWRALNADDIALIFGGV